MPSEVALRMDPGTAPTGTPLSDGRLDGVPRPSVVPALDDDHDVAQGGQEAVADREAPLLRGHAGRGLRDDDAARTPPAPTAARAAADRTWSSPPATTAMGGAPAPQAPSCAAPSMPRARPDTTLTPGGGEVGPELCGHADAVAGRARGSPPAPRSAPSVSTGRVPEAEEHRRAPRGRRPGGPGTTGCPARSTADPERGVPLPGTVDDRARSAPAAFIGPRPGTRRRVRRQQRAQAGRAHGRHGRQRDGVGLRRQVRPARPGLMPPPRHGRRAATAPRTRGRRTPRRRRPARPPCGRPS